MKRNNLLITLTLVIAFCATAVSATAEESSQNFGRISLYGGVGISSAYGEYATESDARTEFSFNPGLRIRLNDIILPDTFFLTDIGYLNTGFVGYVGPTDTYFYNHYEFINLNVMFGTQISIFYAAGGIFYGIGLGANSYREYTDEWVSLSANNDFGIVAEGGIELFSYLSVGVQARCGLISIGSSVDIKTWALYGTLGIHVFRF